MAKESFRLAEQDLCDEVGSTHYRKHEDGWAVRMLVESLEELQACDPVETPYDSSIMADPDIMADHDQVVVAQEARRELLHFLMPWATPMERQVCKLLAADYSVVEIAAMLQVKPSTVRVHLHNLRPRARRIMAFLAMI